jgi:hypothetical protein
MLECCIGVISKPSFYVVQVWDERDQAQILQVQPFLPHSNKEVGEMTALHDRVKQV